MPSSLSPSSLTDLARQLVPVIREAGDVIMAIYNTDFAVEYKGDASPVTEAAGHIPDVKGRFWLVDPLDGTKEFVNQNGEFTVIIALIDAGQAVLGLVYAPALNQLYVGVEGQGAYLEEGGGKRVINTRTPPEEGLTVVASRSHGDASALDEFLGGRKVARTVGAGSSLKLCLVAAGEADVYPRLGRTMEWDIAAGHAVLAAAGGVLTHIDGSDFEYGKPDFANPFFAAWGEGHH